LARRFRQPLVSVQPPAQRMGVDEQPYPRHSQP
jgi:hypothetical protein